MSRKTLSSSDNKQWYKNNDNPKIMGEEKQIFPKLTQLEFIRLEKANGKSYTQAKEEWFKYNEKIQMEEQNKRPLITSRHVNFSEEKLTKPKKWSDILIVSLVVLFFLGLTVSWSIMIGAAWFGNFFEYESIINNHSWFRKITTGIIVIFLMIQYSLMSIFFYKLIKNE